MSDALLDGFMSSDLLPGSPEWRQGQPSDPRCEVIRLCDVPDRPPEPDLIEGMIPARFPSSIYGSGGQLKSYLALLMLICVSAGVPFLGRAVTQSPVIFVDWELDDDVTARRARMLARGLGLAAIPSELLYINADRPLRELIDDVATAASVHAAQLVAIDSLGLAIAASTQSDEWVIPAMGALRGLGIASMVIDHQSRVQTGQEYATKEQYGSVYKGNLSRSAWQLERADPGTDPSVVELVMRHRKVNFGALSPNLGLRVTFAPESVRVEQVDAADTPSLAAKMPSKDRVLGGVLSEPGSTADQLAELTGVAVGNLKNCLTELRGQGLVTAVTGSRREPATWYPTPAAKAKSEYHHGDTDGDTQTLSPPPEGPVSPSPALKGKGDTQTQLESDVSPSDTGGDTHSPEQLSATGDTEQLVTPTAPPGANGHGIPTTWPDGTPYSMGRSLPPPDPSSRRAARRRWEP